MREKAIDATDRNGATRTTYVLMAGLPGTGKTTLANALAERLGGVVISKDTVRAALFPGRFTDFTSEQDDLCFDAVLRAAEYLATRDRASFIFLDGRTFSRRAQIEQAVHAAEAAGAKWKILYATCPDDIVEARLTADAANHPAKNRTVEMYRAVKARFEPIMRPHLEIDTSAAIENAAEKALGYLLEAAKK